MNCVLKRCKLDEKKNECLNLENLVGPQTAVPENAGL